MENFLELKSNLRAKLVKLGEDLETKYSKEFIRFSDWQCDDKYDSRDELQDVLDYVNQYLAQHKIDPMCDLTPLWMHMLKGAMLIRAAESEWSCFEMIADIVKVLDEPSFDVFSTTPAANKV